MVNALRVCARLVARPQTGHTFAVTRGNAPEQLWRELQGYTLISRHRPRLELRSDKNGVQHAGQLRSQLSDS